MADGSNINGVYVADLLQINRYSSTKSIGKVAIVREGDEITAYVKYDLGETDVWHRQDVYLGSSCVSTDTNNDGFIDINEMKAASGNVIVPLDGNLDSQNGGRNQYPVGKGQYGKYFYKEQASFERFFADLKQPDVSSRDNLAKLGDQDGFSFLNRVVIIQGASEKIPLPTTVGTTDGLSRYQTLPVACGTFARYPSLPEEFLNGNENGTVIIENGPSLPTPDTDYTPVPTPSPDTIPMPVPGPTPTPDTTPAPTPTPAPETEEDEGSDWGDWWRDRFPDWSER